MHSNQLDSRDYRNPGYLLLAGVLVASVALLGGCVESGEASTAEPSTDATGQEDSSSATPETEAEQEQEGGSDTDGEDDGKKEDGEEDEEEEAVPVEVVTLDRGQMEAVLHFSANLEAEDHVQVYSQAQRRVTELLVEEGDLVTEGQLLLRLQDQEQRNALEKVRSQLRKAEHDFERQRRLYEGKLISEQAFLDAKYEIDQLEISLDEAGRELSYTQVRAPIAGTVTERKVNLGDTVSFNQHLFDIVDFGSLVARVYVPEKNLALLQPGQPARLAAQALDLTFAGHVVRIAPIVDPKSGTIKVTVAVGGQPGLRPGLYVDVDLVTAIHDRALRVPKRALVYDRDRIFVYRLGDDLRVERVPVVAQLSDRDYVEPDELLAEGDRVVVAGQAGLKTGALVSLPETQEANVSEPAAAEESAPRSSL